MAGTLRRVSHAGSALARSASDLWQTLSVLKQGLWNRRPARHVSDHAARFRDAFHGCAGRGRIGLFPWLFSSSIYFSASTPTGHDAPRMGVVWTALASTVVDFRALLATSDIPLRRLNGVFARPQASWTRDSGIIEFWNYARHPSGAHPSRGTRSQRASFLPVGLRFCTTRIANPPHNQPVSCSLLPKHPPRVGSNHES
jgi:hypothetical protein